MNNEELKEKILSLVRGAMLEADDLPFIEATENITDALIAAGIRDMSDIRSLADNVILSVIAHKAEVRSMEQRAKEAEHRAARAEKALQKFAETITCEDCPFSSDCASSEKMEDLIHSNHCFAEYLKQAEKELAEERE